MLNAEETGVAAAHAGCDIRTDTFSLVKQEQDPENPMPSEEPSPAEAEEDLGERSPTDEPAEAGTFTQEVFDRATARRPARHSGASDGRRPRKGN